MSYQGHHVLYGLCFADTSVMPFVPGIPSVGECKITFYWLIKIYVFHIATVLKKLYLKVACECFAILCSSNVRLLHKIFKIDPILCKTIMANYLLRAVHYI